MLYQISKKKKKKNNACKRVIIKGFQRFGTLTTQTICELIETKKNILRKLLTDASKNVEDVSNDIPLTTVNYNHNNSTLVQFKIIETL